jgi:hypothetical protein
MMKQRKKNQRRNLPRKYGLFSCVRGCSSQVRVQKAATDDEQDGEEEEKPKKKSRAKVSTFFR